MPEDYLPPIPAGLDLSETNINTIRDFFERDMKARQQRKKNRRKHDKKRRKQLRSKM